MRPNLELLLPFGMMAAPLVAMIEQQTLGDLKKIFWLKIMSKKVLKSITTLFVCSLLWANLSVVASEAKRSEPITIMSLNVYGWKTMPQHSKEYAQLIKTHNLDIVAIQEGADDWQLNTPFPTDYRHSRALHKSLGSCWGHKYQIFINHCKGNKFVKSSRVELTNGPNATRTAEYAIIEKLNDTIAVINIHWDHESKTTREANAKETIALVSKLSTYPVILLGDFNSPCQGEEVTFVRAAASMVLQADAGIDCALVKGLQGSAQLVPAPPSDHPAIITQITVMKNE